MERFEYDRTARKRGAAAVWTAVAGYVLFAFFLLAGFGDQSWMPYALAGLTAVMLLLFLYGLSQMRAGSGSVEVTDEGITTVRGGVRLYVEWQRIDRISFGGFFHPALRLHGGEKTLVIYKSLPGYLTLWQRFQGLAAMPEESDGDTVVGSYRSRQMGLWIVVLALLAASACVIIMLGAALQPVVLVVTLGLHLVVAGICVWALLHNACRYTFSVQGFQRRSLFRNMWYPAAEIKDVTLEQTPLQLVVTDYRYRGEAMTRSVRYSEKGLGLRLRIKLADGELMLDETMTRFPLELLFGELCRRYAIAGKIIPSGDGGQ